MPYCCATSAIVSGGAAVLSPDEHSGCAFRDLRCSAEPSIVLMTGMSVRALLVGCEASSAMQPPLGKFTVYQPPITTLPQVSLHRKETFRNRNCYLSAFFLVLPHRCVVDRAQRPPWNPPS